MRSLCLMIFLVASAIQGDAGMVKVLLLSGSNNHDWKATTPVLKEILEDSGLFQVDVQLNVAGMTADSFKPYDVIVSNFNTFGMKHPGEVWNARVRAAFVDFISQGKGFVVIHAGSASFYDWPEFQKIAGATWGKGTSHGKIHQETICMTNSTHPITAGLHSFATVDEFWQNAQLDPGAEILAQVTPGKDFGGSGKPEPMALTTHFGRGRGFTLLLGHNVQGMQSEGFKALLIRGTQWAATGAVDPAGHAKQSK